MTTTDRPRSGPAPEGRPQGAVRPLVATGVIGAVLATCAALTTGPSGAWGVVVGVVLTFASLGLGSVVLAWVTDITPAMSLVVALMTYTLQVVLLLAAYVVLQGDESARAAVSGPWLGGTVIATTVVWLALQVRSLFTSRQPYFDLASDDASQEGPDRVGTSRPGGPEAGTT